MKRCLSFMLCILMLFSSTGLTAIASVQTVKKIDFEDGTSGGFSSGSVLYKEDAPDVFTEYNQNAVFDFGSSDSSITFDESDEGDMWVIESDVYIDNVKNNSNSTAQSTTMKLVGDDTNTVIWGISSGGTPSFVSSCGGWSSTTVKNDTWYTIKSVINGEQKWASVYYKPIGSADSEYKPVMMQHSYIKDNFIYYDDYYKYNSTSVSKEERETALSHVNEMTSNSSTTFEEKFYFDGVSSYNWNGTKTHVNINTNGILPKKFKSVKFISNNSALDNYIDNFSFTSYKPLYKAMSGILTAEEVENTLSVYSGLGSFDYGDTSGIDMDKVYTALTNKTYGSTEEFLAEYNECLTADIDPAIKYIKITSGINNAANQGDTVYITYDYKAVKANTTDIIWTVSGASDSDTHYESGKLYIGNEEKSGNVIKLTATSRFDNSVNDTAVFWIREDTDYLNDNFDDSRIVSRFALSSDIHLNGQGSGQQSVIKFAHLIDVVQKAAGTKEDGTPNLDALLINGDLVDGIQIYDCASANSTVYGKKVAQDYRSVEYMASCLEGKNTNTSETVENGKSLVDDSLFGAGLDKNIKVFYSLGNHDARGKGITRFDGSAEAVINKYGYSMSDVYSSEYIAAIMCGWKYDASKSSAPDGAENSYITYINDLIDICGNDNVSAKEKDEFTQKYGTSCDTAIELFKRYYGYDTVLTRDEYGLLYGNRHMKIGNFHFIALELEGDSDSAGFLDKYCAISVKEDPTKPIFVLNHYKVKDTVYASYYGAVSDGVKAVLEKYPQAVVWGGHSHTFLNNENAIMQTKFTNIESATTAYFDKEEVYEEVPDMQNISANYLAGGISFDTESAGDVNDFGECVMVSVDVNNNVKIERIDVNQSYKNGNGVVYIKQPWIINGINPSGDFLCKYSESYRLSEESLPMFDRDAYVTHTDVANGEMTVTFSSAYDNDNVKYYSVSVYDAESGALKAVKYVTSGYWKYANDETMRLNNKTYSCKITGLDDSKEYRTVVNAVDCWKLVSADLTEDGFQNAYRIESVVCDGDVIKGINIFSSSYNADVYIATYNGSEMISLSKVKVDSLGKKKYDLSIDISNCSNIKCFIWKSDISSLVPLAKSLLINKKG